MNFNLLILCFTINIIISIGIPIGVLVYIAIKKRRYLKSYLIGAIVFFISQIVLRLPILNFLNTNLDLLMILSSFYPIIYSIILGLTAGLFEEIGRLLGFKYGLKKNRSYKDGLAFGIGHGGIEAIIITGAASIQNLIILISLNNGTFDSVKFGLTMEEAIRIYSSLGGFTVLIGGIERVFAMCIHLGLSIMVLYGVNKRKSIYFLLAVLIHGIIDGMLGILQCLGIGVIGIEVWVFICAIALIIYTVKCKKFFKEGDNIL